MAQRRPTPASATAHDAHRITDDLIDARVDESLVVRIRI